MYKQLEDSCKTFQKIYDYKLIPQSYVIFHLDGKNFSRFCKRFNKPYDDDFIFMMNETALFLCTKIPNIKIGYVQSDEITLFYDSHKSYLMDKSNNDWFNNRICKLCSIAASLATSKFTSLLYNYYIDKTNIDNINNSALKNIINSIPLIQFDCKVWNVPEFMEVYNWFTFRQIDCIRNSKQMLAQKYFSNKELLHKSTNEQIKEVKEKFNINWETDFDDGKKFGRIISKKPITINNNGQEIIRFKFICDNAFKFTNDDSLTKFKLLCIQNKY